MRPKGKLFALLAIFAAIGLVTATGAFTTVSAERTVTASTAGDQSALLQLDPVDANYADTDSNDRLQITINNLNRDANTTIDSVFRITNQGSQNVGVYIETTTDSIDYYWGDQVGNSSEGPDRDVTLGVGGSVEVGVEIDLIGQTSVTANGITIVAEADQAGNDGDGSADQ